MSISALSSVPLSNTSGYQDPFKEIQQDFNQLAKALQSGDLSAAQSAFSNLQQLQQNGPGQGVSNSSGFDTIQNDFSTLGQDLQSGNLSQAKSAFEKLQSDLKSLNHGSSSLPQPPDQYIASNSQGSVQEEVAQDYSKLVSALQSGNSSEAKSVFAALQQTLDGQSLSTTGTVSSTGGQQ